MIDTYSVPLKRLVEDFKLEIAHTSTDFESIRITVEDVARPGLQLAGFFDHYEPMRLQVMGNVEMSYTGKLSSGNRSAIFDRLFSYKFPAMVISRNNEPDELCLAMAKKHNVTVLRSPKATGAVVTSIITYLKAALAPRITRHGVLVEVYGEGILLKGDSGVGKSEAAVELLKRGHRLVADDAVDIKKVSNKTLVGSSPELIRYFMELRGIGIIDVRRIFGTGAVKPTEKIDLIINLHKWEEGKAYDRMGEETNFEEIMGIFVPALEVPIRPGRNLAVIIEVAAMNNRNKKMGYNAAKELSDKLYSSMLAQTGDRK